MLFNLPCSALLFTLLSLHVLALPTANPDPSAEITVTHSDGKTGTSSSHTIDPTLLHPDLVKALNGSDVNINVVMKKVRSNRNPVSVLERRAVNNSIINLTIVSDDKNEKRADDDDETSHHNVYIDASAGNGTAGAGIVGSTININLNSRSPAPEAAAAAEPETTVGDHSILIDTTGAGSSGISDSTVHVNILPARADTSTGDHSVVVKASSASSGTTTTGKNSAVVDASAAEGQDATAASGINGSTINLTVISPKDNKKRGDKRSPRNRGSDLWKQKIKRKAFVKDDSTIDSATRFQKRVIQRGVNGLIERHASKPSTMGSK